MANLTLVVDDQLLRLARMRALREDTSVNAVVRGYLAEYAAAEGAAEAAAGLVALARRADAGSGSSGRTWRRDDAYAGRA